MKGLREVARHLKRAGVRRLYVNGSFVTDKPHPNDFDGCYPAEEADMHLLETPLYTHNREDMKARYGGEVFPDVYIPGRGRDPLVFFQSTRAGEPKGIVVLDLEELP